jgi:GR25 family glycosyltransferase involved in LPS biosynthesis
MGTKGWPAYNGHINIPMKGYVVTLTKVPESLEVAIRCAKSAKPFGIDIEIVDAVTKANVYEELKKEGLKVAKFDESYSNTDAVLANFVTQYKIWKRIRDTFQPGIVLEHDAVFVGPVPTTIEGDLVNLGKPSYGNFISKNKPGIYPLFSKKGGYFPGAHGYYVSPIAAEWLIRTAQDLGASPCDLFLCNTNFPEAKELYPWVVEAQDSFSTIQKEKGCLAKHNYDKKKYSLL